MGSKTSKESKLDKTSLKHYQALTQLSEDEIQEWYEEFSKECPNGQLKIEKFKQIFIKYFNGEHATVFSKAIFQEFDKADVSRKKDDSLDFGEFLLALSPTSQLKFENHLRLLFDVYAPSKSNRVNEAMLRKIIKRMFDLVGDEKFISGDGLTMLVNDLLRELGDDNTDGWYKKETLIAQYNIHFLSY